jgi:hypothetical protein
MHTVVERAEHTGRDAQSGTVKGRTPFHLLLNLRPMEEAHAGCRARHIHDDLPAQHQVRVVSVRLVLLIVLHSQTPTLTCSFLKTAVREPYC